LCGGIDPSKMGDADPLIRILDHFEHLNIEPGLKFTSQVVCYSSEDDNWKQVRLGNAEYVGLQKAYKIARSIDSDIPIRIGIAA